MITMTADIKPEAIKNFEEFHHRLLGAPMARILKKMAAPVVDLAKMYAPDSIVSGTRNKWGKHVTEHFNPHTWAMYSSGDTVDSKPMVLSDTKPSVLVGPTWPYGNKQNFNNSKKPRKVVLWGKMPRNIPAFRPGDNPRFVDRAGDDARAAAINAFERAAEQELLKLVQGMFD